jgi:Flp pilus assembly protein TadG
MMISQPRKPRKRLRTNDRGVAAVEFALVLPILLTVTLGAIDWGYYFFIDQMVTNAAREAARAGSLLDPAKKTSGDVEAAAESAANAYLAKCKLTKTAVITPEFLSPFDDGSQAIKVTIQYPVGSLTGFLKAFLPADAKGTAVMRWQ